MTRKTQKNDQKKDRKKTKKIQFFNTLGIRLQNSKMTKIYKKCEKNSQKTIEKKRQEKHREKQKKRQKKDNFFNHLKQAIEPNILKIIVNRWTDQKNKICSGYRSIRVELAVQQNDNFSGVRKISFFSGDFQEKCKCG